MWIFDSYAKGCVELWGREKGLTKVSAAYPPSFYMHLDDPAGHMEMIEGWKVGIRSRSAASGRSMVLSKVTESLPAAR